MSVGCVSILNVAGTSATPTSSLARGAWFWRATARVGGAPTSAASAVWEFFVGARSAAVSSTWINDLDLNGDGLADIAITNASGGIAIGLGASSGAPAALTVTTSGPGEGSGGSLANAGDVNGDGYSDMLFQTYRTVAAANVYSQWVIYGAATVPTAATLFGAPSATPRGRTTSVGDVNGDGYGDVAYATTDVSISIVYGSATGLSSVPAIVLPTPFAASSSFGGSLRSADFNADRFPDLVVGAAQAGTPLATGRLAVYMGTGTGFAAPRLLAPVEVAGQTQFGMVGATIAIGDFNGDGYGDFTTEAELANFQRPPAHVWFGSATGIAAAPSQLLLSPTVGILIGSCASGDFNGDGFTDVAYGGDSAGTNGGMSIYFGGATGLTSSGIFIPSTSSLGRLAFYAGYNISPGDVEGDGFADLLGSAGYGTPTRVQYHRGSMAGPATAPTLNYDFSPAFNGAGSLW